MYFHGFENGGALLILGLILTSSAMVLWFRDVILEGKKKINLLLTHAAYAQKGSLYLPFFNVRSTSFKIFKFREYFVSWQGIESSLNSWVITV